MSEINALYIESLEQINIKKLERKPLGETQVRIAVKRVSLCGSDYKLFNGGYNAPGTYPIIPGHEWAGEIIETGSEVSNLSVGDRVTGDCSRYCGKCVNCLKDKNLCSDIEKYGITIDGYAVTEAVADQKYIYRADPCISFKALALAEPFCVAYHALDKVIRHHICNGSMPLLKKKRMLIIGCGAVGTAAYILAKYHFDFEKVFVFDSDSRIRQLTNAAGEDVMMYVPDKHSGSRVNKWGTRGSSYANIYNMGSFDIVCEFAGVSEAFDMAMRETAAGGSIVTIGFYGNTTCDAGLITLKGLSVFGSIGGTGEFENVLDFLKLHGDKAERMVVAEYPLENAAKAFTRNHSGKCQIVFDERTM